MQKTSSEDVRLAKDLHPDHTHQPIPLSWPFAQWGLHMVGKLHKSWPGGHVYMLVGVDKFTKSIVFCFGVPHIIITDNGTNFTSKELKNYL
jgi:hypothetical protein